jgi:hypothetical protein
VEPGLLAFHYLRAEEWEQALELRARRSVRAGAVRRRSALSHYQQALNAADRPGGATARRLCPAIYAAAATSRAGRAPREAIEAFKRR